MKPLLVSLTRYLLKQGYAQSQITLLSPYHGQVVKIRSFLKKVGLEEVAAHAVDDFQGEENDIVLLSLVRSNSQGKIGFLKDKNRLCVALSRAKRGFYCIGNLDCISAGSGLWKELTHLLRSKDLLGEELTLLCQNHPDAKTAVKCRADFSKIPEGGCSLECQTRLECGHPCKRRCHPLDKDHRTNICQFPCSRSLCEFNHKCPRKCSEVCRPCCVEVERVIPKCGHSQMVPCHIPTEAWACKEPCQRPLECGHPCKLFCGQDCRSRVCKESVQVTLPCLHTTQTDCFRQKMPLRCSEKCKQTLECGHRCQGSCGECIQGRMHVACRKKCARVLLCSHVCRGSCCENCPPCEKRCLRKCSHSWCDKPCGEVCFPCTQPCTWICEHFQCTQTCSDICDRPRCNEPCRKTLKCKHPCAGLCGEPCPPKCRVCHRDELAEIFFGNEDEPEARFVVLAECGHIFEVGGLDQWMDGAAEEGVAEHVQQKVCPKCSTPIQSNPRYNSLLKAQQQHLDEIKEKIQGGKLELQAGKTDLLSRLNRMPLDTCRLVGLRISMMRSSSMQSLRSWENTVSFLESIQRLKVQAEKCSKERRETLSGCTKAVENWLWDRRKGDAFTAQQLREGRNEIKRISYLANVFERLSSYKNQLPPESSAAVDEALQLLNRQEPFTDAEEDLLLPALARIDTLLPASGVQLSKAERVSIMAAMRFGRGHWYRCPQGHLYTVGECGRPMQESRCPECGAAIGGRDHRLHASNAAANHQMLNPVEDRTGGGHHLGNIVELAGPLALPGFAPAAASHQLGSPPHTSGSPREAGPDPSDWLMPPHSPLASPGYPGCPTSPSCIQPPPASPDASPPDSPSLPVSTFPGPASPGDHPSEETGFVTPEPPKVSEGDPMATLQLQPPAKGLEESQEPPELTPEPPIPLPPNPSHEENGAQGEVGAEPLHAEPQELGKLGQLPSEPPEAGSPGREVLTGEQRRESLSGCTRRRSKRLAAQHVPQTRPASKTSKRRRAL